MSLRATCSALAVTLFAPPAFAEPTRVTLVTAGDETRAGAFTASLAELLSRLHLSLDVRRDADAGTVSGEAVAAVAAEFTEPDACTLTVVDQLGRTVLVRRVGRAATPALQAEAAAHVVQAVVEELVALAAWTPPAVEPPPLAQPPLEQAAVAVATVPAASAPPGRLGLDVGAFFGGRTFLNGAPITPGGGITVSLAVKLGNFRPMLTLLGDYHAPFERASPIVSLRIETLSTRALLSLDVLGADGWRIDLALGAGADVFFSTPSSETLAPSRLKPRTDADPVLTAMVTGRVAIASSVDLYLALAVDFDTWPVQFVGTAPLGAGPTFYQVFPVRPSLVLGFSFNTFGADPYWSSK